MPEPVTICAICRRTLDVVTTPDGGEYRHTLQDPDDHPVVPVSSDRRWRARCDFCNAEDGTYRVPARDFTIPGLDGHGSYGDWCACTPCAMLIDSNRWNDVLRRSIEGHRRTSGEQLNEAGVSALRSLHRTLRKNITGSLVEVNEEQ